MESSINEYEHKITKVLQQFLIPEYKIGNDTYLEIFLSQISGKYDAELGERLLTNKIFTNWLDQAITKWEQQCSPIALPSIPIQSFTLNLSSLISSNETEFIKLDLINLYTRMCNLFNVEHENTNVSIKLAYVRLLTAFLSYESGVKWILQTGRWKHVLHSCYKGQTIYITRESQKFFLKLLETVDDQYSDLILNEILLPLQTVHKSEIKNDEIEDDLTPMLTLIRSILHELYLKLNRNITKIFNRNQNDFEQNLWNLVNTSHNNRFHIILANILAQIYFGMLNTDEPSSDTTLIQFRLKIYALSNLLINKRSFVAFFKTVKISHIYCSTFKSSFSNPDMKNMFNNQLVMFQIIPIGTLIHVYMLQFDSNYCKSNDEIMDLYISKLFKISCEDTVRLCYMVRDAILIAGPKVAHDLCVQSIRLAMETRKYYERDQIIIVFQHLMYVLLNISDATRDNKLPIELIRDTHGVISHLLDSLSILITEFKLTWRDCVETICILDKSVNLLNSEQIGCRVTILTLKLIQLAIDNFMAPNLALLMDSIECSSALVDLGPLLYKRLHHVEWEVRDSVLEVLYTLIVISECKFPAFQKLMLTNNLCTIIVDKSVNDLESYVRAMALKCITAMIKIDTFWNQVLEKENLLEKTISILKNESEGIVRREGVAVITELYENERIKSDIELHKLYKTMSTLTLTDLHWEVKQNGIEFWRQVICKQLSHQGMIDGTFPDVTFSKENRKIIVLTDVEIKNRLLKVLKFLSANDCLTVLIYCLYDQCDIIVVNTALHVLLKMKKWYGKYNMLVTVKNVEQFKNDIFHKTQTIYKFIINNIDKNKSKNSDNDNTNITDNTDNDNVIESIVNSKDINLLVNVFNKQTNNIVTDNDKMIIDKSDNDNDNVHKITPELFLQYLGTIDPESVANERNLWLTNCTFNLNSLLDDILKSYDNDNMIIDVNSMDCY